MIEIIKRKEGTESAKERIDGNKAQISYNSDGHICIRITKYGCNEDTLIVLDETASYKLYGFCEEIKIKRFQDELPFFE